MTDLQRAIAEHGSLLTLPEICARIVVERGYGNTQARSVAVTVGRMHPSDYPHEDVMRFLDTHYPTT